MARDPTRRQLLLLSGSSLSLLAGCGTTLDRLEGGGAEAPPTDSPTPRSTESPTATDATATETGSASGTETGNESTNESDGTVTATPDVDISAPELSISGVQLPDDPGQHDYATMGSTDATATATVYGNWKCPYTRQFVVEQLGGIVEEFVAPGDLAIRFRALAYRSGEPFLGPDAPRAARAGLSVWHTDPKSYWSYVAYVFGNQPPERRDWATADLLLRFADAAGVNDTDQIENELAREAYADAVSATVEKTTDLDVHTVPRVAVDGSVTAPTLDPESTTKQLEDAVGR